jgi:uncharacterized lipoprotein YddW (UPF0748 family)
MKRSIFVLLLILAGTQLFAQYPSQKYALRGVWITTVGNYDWPSNPGTTAWDIQQQKNQLIAILDAHKRFGMNAMFFNARVDCDALYKSSIEPWSRYLTGDQGAPPSDPNYDPLQLAITESHKRGMELHAWLNPYRAQNTSNDVACNTHVTKVHPEWIVSCSSSSYKFLNPGLPEVRAYLVKVIMDMVRRYDLDGIHFDDFFYPYPEYGSFNDDAAYNKYKGNFTTKASWRKNNVNLLLATINDSIKAVKPWVKFGISPAALAAVNTDIFADTFGWLRGNYVDTLGVSYSGTAYLDYIMPQLYDVKYSNLLGDWCGPTTLNGRHLYIGLPAYRYEETEHGFTPNELGWEIKTNRSTPTCGGEVYFRSMFLTDLNTGGCVDTLMHNYYVYPAIPPKMGWKPGSDKAPNAPVNLRIELNTSTNKYELKWDKPAPTKDGDTAFVYAVYRFENTPSAADLEDPTKMFGTTGQTVYSMANGHFSVTNGLYYAVTAFNRYSNESSMSNVYKFTVTDKVPATPVLTAPANNINNLSTFAVFSWNALPSAESYQIQISKDSTFTQIICNLMEIKTNSYKMFGLKPAQKYYWRIRAFGISGASQFSQTFNFMSGIPVSPVNLLPVHTATNIPVNPVLKWNKSEGATSYRVQVGTNALMTSGIILDTTVTDTTLALKNLSPNKVYNWHVLAKNSLGQSDWTQPVNGFKTGTSTSVEKDEVVSSYTLGQNYPNPFNPVTKINYSLEKPGSVKLSVFNLLGQEVAVLVNEYQNAGTYNVSFDINRAGTNLTSGIYFYTLKTGDYSITRKMTILK